MLQKLKPWSRGEKTPNSGQRLLDGSCIQCLTKSISEVCKEMPDLNLQTSIQVRQEDSHKTNSDSEF